MLVTDEGMVEFLHPTISLLLVVSIIALQLLRESNVGFPCATEMVVSPVQSAKAPTPILVTLLGMVTEVKLVQL